MKVKIPNSVPAQLDDLPNKCPFCHHTINPNVLMGHHSTYDKLEVFMFSPSTSCKKSFIAYYVHSSGVHWKYSGKSSIGNVLNKQFSDTVLSISPAFSVIYNQSYYAEQNGLVEICGVGYRKSLEFLIKDYSILYHPSEQEKIEKKLLGACIEQCFTVMLMGGSQTKNVQGRKTDLIDSLWIQNRSAEATLLAGLVIQ